MVSFYATNRLDVHFAGRLTFDEDEPRFWMQAIPTWSLSVISFFEAGDKNAKRHGFWILKTVSIHEYRDKSKGASAK